MLEESVIGRFNRLYQQAIGSKESGVNVDDSESLTSSLLVIASEIRDLRNELTDTANTLKESILTLTSTINDRG